MSGQSWHLEGGLAPNLVRRVGAVVALLAAALAVADSESDTEASAVAGDHGDSVDNAAQHGRSVDGSSPLGVAETGGNDAETRLNAGVYYLLFVRRERAYGVPASDDADQAETDEGGDTTERTPSARYSVTFTAQWTAAEHGPVPSGAHFTTLAGAAVNADADLWTPGELASRGLENLAELGRTSTFLAEIAAAREAGDAGESVTSAGTGAVGTSVFEVAVSAEKPSFTFASMVAPSPDWFVGLSEFSLLDDEGRWVEDTGDMGLPAWDAGTETGNRFSLDGRPTIPPQSIRLLTETVSNGVEFDDGTVNGNYLASIRFRRIP